MSAWDAWADAERAIAESAEGPAPLVCVLFAHEWSPPARYAAAQARRLRDDPGFAFVRIFVVSADAERAGVCRELGVAATPAVLFVFRGERMVVQRPEREDSCLFVGSPTSQQLEELVRVARQSAVQRLSRVAVDF